MDALGRYGAADSMTAAQICRQGGAGADSGQSIEQDSAGRDSGQSIGQRDTIAQGVTFEEGTFRGTPYHMVRIDRSKAPYDPRPYKVPEKRSDTVSNIDRVARSLATINGTFFDTAHPGTTIFGEVKTDDDSYQPTMVKKRTYWAVTHEGAYEMGETVPAGKDIYGSTLFSIPPEKWKSFRYVLGGGGRLVDDGRKSSTGAGINDEQFLSDVLARRNRTAVGFSQNEKTFWMVSCDSPGWTPQETADFFVGLGAEEAMFLDGGGSTEMVVHDRIVTKLSAGAERAMPTAIVAVPESSKRRPKAPRARSGAEE